MDALIQEFRIDLTLIGAEHLPADPRALFISNHPLGGLDGICLTHLIASHYQTDIRYIVNDLLVNLKPLANIFVPVNKYGAQARTSIQKMHEALESDLPVIKMCIRDRSYTVPTPTGRHSKHVARMRPFLLLSNDYAYSTPALAEGARRHSSSWACLLYTSRCV